METNGHRNRHRDRLKTSTQHSSTAAPQHSLGNMTQLPRISTEEMPVPEDFGTAAPQHRSIVLAM